MRLKVTNWMGSDWGEGFIDITVHEASHVNSPPVPIILPSADEVVSVYTNPDIQSVFAYKYKYIF